VTARGCLAIFASFGLGAIALGWALMDWYATPFLTVFGVETVIVGWVLARCYEEEDYSTKGKGHH